MFKSVIAIYSYTWFNIQMFCDLQALIKAMIIVKSLLAMQVIAENKPQYKNSYLRIFPKVRNHETFCNHNITMLNHAIDKCKCIN